MCIRDRLGPARDRGVDVEFHKRAAAVLHGPARQHLEVIEERRRLRPAMGLDEPDHHVDAVGLQGARRGEHRVGLAHAGRHAEKYLELATALLGGNLQQALRRGSLRLLRSRFRHAGPV